MKHPSRATVRLIRARDLCRCVRCGTSEALTTHHRRPKGQGGSTAPDTHQPPNLLTLCWTCHLGYVELYRADARDDGYLVRQGQDPSTVPVRWHGEWVLLHPDGTVEAQRRTA